MILRSIFAALALFALAPVAVAQKPDPTYDYSDSDAAMNGAIEDARESYPQFLATFRAAPTGSRGAFMVKVGLPTSEGGPEHIWVEDLRFEGQQLVGVLANEPADLPGLNLGSRVEINEAQISDWSIISAEGMYGNFTTRVMLPDLPADQANEFRQMLTPNPLPDSWSS
jgi:uncharacterized protein YegJ (DUF2314 family)